MHVLVVDDNVELLELVATSLEREGHRVTSLTSAGAAEEHIGKTPFDVIVLDIGLPDGSGIDVCRSARARGVPTPILFLTANAAVDQRVEGLDAGADDFLGKPFAVAELRARVRALGRRSGRSAPRTWSRGDVSLDFPKRLATVAGREVPLTAKEWNILDVLAAAEGRVVARSRILDEVWRGGDASAAASLDVLMTRIRKKLGSETVRTLRGEGYALA
ncbi:MAG: two component transcriptional regulator, winged helix family protein [Labilithrix sp.]|nr:two component transcriptional regulator, winged helix family protein [Labilithrix sp.]